MHNGQAADDSAQQADARIRIMEAIARGVLVTARYNGQTMTLAPHALFARHGALFLRALNLAKTWRTAEDRRLGQFKLDGLAQVMVTNDPFEPLPDSRPFLANENEELLLAVA
jgi:hypothetical protein